MSDPKEPQNSPENNVEASEASSTDASADKKKPSTNRRQFVTGVATALGGGLLLHTANQASPTENNAAEVRSRILSRIQDDLKRTQNELVFGYEKPDKDTPYGRYVKPDKPAAEIEAVNQN